MVKSSMLLRLMHLSILSTMLTVERESATMGLIPRIVEAWNGLLDEVKVLIKALDNV